MKNLIVFLFLLTFSQVAHATTWYVRDGGGTSSQCTGTTNAVYPGSGTGQNCAFNSTMYLTGFGCGNYNQGGYGCNVAPLMSGSDIVYVNGDSDLVPGTQAQFRVGYLSTGYNPSGCNSAGNCNPGGLRPGTLANPTSIIGVGTHRPQIWGSGGIGQVINADADYVLLNNLEITDHSSCQVNVSCDTTGARDNWAKYGVYYGGTGSVMKNLWIHGLYYGTSSDNITNYLSYNNIISGNSYNGDGPGDVYSTGTVTFTGPLTWDTDIIVFNGCGENYPVHSSSPYDLANYHDCYDQNSTLR